MAKQFDNLDKLAAASLGKEQVEEVLLRHVAPLVEDILHKHVVKDVYGAYKSLAKNPYHRRGSLTSGITSKIIDGDVLLVTALAQPAKPADGWVSSGDGAFLQMLEVGDLGWWRKDFPRPAISNAQREVNGSIAVKRVMERGLKQVMKK